ncbi:hypothetical protein [Mesorhizobium sp. B2-7-1]|uniref:hypothetical protein n=1 Tax=Mesorhizobium sp. B2-7-1 TaxID=2589909 RepID=UPI001127E2F1|nr:hypothetical protein [Mesorhizobium sp. B2-7-1]TPJ46836.1 hypothetical protein FJ471_31370 [Mesorhizobium sp. B2-7-1]
MISNSLDGALELIKPPAEKLERCESAISRAIEGLKNVVHLRAAPTPRQERQRFGKIRDLAMRMQKELQGVHELVAAPLLAYVDEIKAAADLFDPVREDEGIQVGPGAPTLDPVHLQAAYLSRNLLWQFSAVPIEHRPEPTLGPVQSLASLLLLYATGEEADLHRASRRVVRERTSGK